MNREKVIELVEKYVQSWVNRERNEFLETLHDSAIVRECNGPAYSSLREAGGSTSNSADRRNRAADRLEVAKPRVPVELDSLVRSSPPDRRWYSRRSYAIDQL